MPKIVEIRLIREDVTEKWRGALPMLFKDSDGNVLGQVVDLRFDDEYTVGKIKLQDNVEVNEGDVFKMIDADLYLSLPKTDFIDYVVIKCGRIVLRVEGVSWEESSFVFKIIADNIKQVGIFGCVQELRDNGFKARWYTES